MKKRLLSLALCLALCLGLLPVGVLATEIEPSEDHSTTVASSDVDCNHKDTAGNSTISADGKCSQCNTQFVAKTGLKYYTSLDDAMNMLASGGSYIGGTIHVLTDAEMPENATGSDNKVRSVSLDLNGHTVTSNSNGTSVSNGGNLTLEGSGTFAGTIELVNGTLSLLTDRNYTWNGTVEEILVSSSTGTKTLKINSGTVQALILKQKYGSKSEITGGTFDKIVNDTGSDLKVKDLLAPGYVATLNGQPVAADTLIDKNGITNISVTKCDHTNINADTFVCNTCGAALEAKITAKDESEHYVVTLDSSDFDNENSIVLLRDTRDNIRFVATGTCTVDLNGHSAYRLTGRSPQGTLTVKGPGTAKVLDVGSSVGSGTVVILNDTVTVNELYVYNNRNTKLTCGTIKNLTVYQSGTTAADILENGYAFTNEDGQVVNGYVTSINKVTISNHTHILDESGTCPCGFTCDHSSGMDDNGKCKNCGQLLGVARVTKDNSIAYYTDLAEAIANSDGGTVTMLNNATVSASIGTSSDFTLDLNGKTITGGSNVASIFRTFGNVVVCDNSNDKTGLVIGTSSSSGNGNFNLQGGKLTIKGGTFNSSTLTAAVYANTGELIIEGGTFNGEVTSYVPTSISSGTFHHLYTNYAIADLLKDGYGFKKTDGNWLSATELGKLSVWNVTVAKAPLNGITVTSDKDIYSYGETVTLKAEMSNASSSVSYQWYKLQSNTTANSNSSVDSIDNSSSTTCVLTDLLPNFLDSLGFYRSYVYYCTATCDGYTTGRSVRFTVTKADLSNATVEVTNPTYNGDKQSPTLKVSLGGKTLRENRDYTVVVTQQTDAGSYTLTINGMGNYTGTATSNWNITPKTVTNPTIELSSGPFTYTGQKIEPTVTVMDEGKTIPDSEYTVSYESNIYAGIAKIIITDKENGNYTVSGNTTFVINKAAPTYTPPMANDLTYNGTTQELFKAGTTQDGTMLYSMSKTSDFLPNVPLIRRAGTYTFYYQVRGDGNHTDSDIGTITVTIKKAPLTITAKDKSAYVGSTAPDLSKPELNKDYTVSGLFDGEQLTKSPVLSYATEKPDMSQVGSVDINISDADAGGNYTITYVSGKLNITTRSSSGGSSNSGTKTDTVKNPDGSTTKTETKADGSKTETTTASSAGGSTGTTVTKTDSQGNRTTEAEAKLSEKDVKNAQETGEAVQVPVKKIESAKGLNSAPELKIELPNGAGKTTVEIPVEGASSGTVAVIVHPDGTEEIVKDSIPTENGVQLELSGTTTIKILDNSKTFDDTKDHWSRDEVNFVAARELFQGVGNNQFGVSQPMTRGMVNTVLARLAGLDTTPGQGQTWYEVGTDWAVKHGISDGTNPTAPVTREQLATLLYRYAGSPNVSGTLNAADAGAVSDYAKDALLWANQNGIVNGVGNNTIAPKDNAQRAQVAAMLARYLQNQ